MKYVIMRKVSAVDSPAMPSGDSTTYPFGQRCETGQSLPEGYELAGWLITPPTVGRRVEILRCARMGVASLGYYFSTPVTLVQGEMFYTSNSVYRLVELSQQSDLKEASAATGFVLLLASEGGSVDAKNAATLYGGPNCSEEAVRIAGCKGEMIAIRDGNGNLHFPAWQFGPRGGLLPGITEVLAILAPRSKDDDLAPVTFFLNKTARLEGRSPIQALRLGGEGMVKAVKQLAIESTE